MHNGTTERARAWVGRVAARLGELEFLRSLARKAGCRFLLRRHYVAVRHGDREIRISRENSVYAQDLIRDFTYYFDAVEPRNEAGLRVVDYSRPALHIMNEGRLPFWFPELAEPMETTELYLDRANLKTGETVFDLGAYAGGATYHFSRAVGPGGRVFAFEPDPKSFDCLARNIALHGLYNVSSFRLGVWSRGGRVLFQSEGSMGSAVVEASARSSDTKEWIDVVSLSEFCAGAEIPRVDFVKIDVEGSEGPILRAATDFIRRYRPRFVVEVHWVQGTRSDRDVVQTLEANGYSVEVLDQAGLAVPLLFARPD